MSGNTSVNSHSSSDCVICFQEISNSQKTTQPHNPRKVFKACLSYLKPEIFTKHSKWDFLSQLERRTPFCSMCASSGEKLSALNDRLEELQKEIRSFVKYFAKEVQLLQRNQDDENETSEDEVDGDQEEEEFVNVVSLRSQSTNSNEVKTIPAREINSSAAALKSKDDPRSENMIKLEIIEDQDWNPEEEDYTVPSTEDDDNSDDESYTPRKTGKKENTTKHVQNQTGDELKRKKRKVVSKIAWKEISFSEEKLKQGWIRRSSMKTSHYIKEYFYCKLGGKKCPALMMKKSYMGVHYYENGEAHLHSKYEHHGISREIKFEVRKILSEDPNAKPNFILDMIKLSTGVELQKAKLVNLLMYEKRKKLIKNGLYEKKESPVNYKGQKRRGRPPGSRSSFLPPINSESEPSNPVQTTNDIDVINDPGGNSANQPTDNSHC